MTNLTRAHQELFRREPDERFASVASLLSHCQTQKRESEELWWQPDKLATRPVDTSELRLAGTDGAELRLNHWSFGQLCSLCGVHRGPVNRLRADTAAQIFRETLPAGQKPMQVRATGQHARAIHGASYTRLYNADLLDVALDAAEGFEPPPKGISGATGLYCGEQDMFAFLIDPTGWVEINGESFAPGLFCWNSEVGRRSLGVQTFWYQRICSNHIVWDAVEVVEFTRKHTANVHDSLNSIREIVRNLVRQRNERRDGFAKIVQQAMGTRLAATPEEAIGEVTKQRIPGSLAKQAIEAASQQGSLTIFNVVDALTRLTQRSKNAGERTAIDQKAAALLQLAA